MIKFPAAIDTIVELPTVVDNKTPVEGFHVNNMRDAILAIEAELGVKPSGVYSTVRSRFAALELALNNLVLGSVTFGGDLLSTSLVTQKVIALQGRNVSNTTPTDGYILTWVLSNNQWEPKPAPVGFTAGGDLTGSNTSQTVAKVNGITYPATSLTIGQVPRATGASTVAYGALDLSNSNAVANTLPVNRGGTGLNTAGSNGQILSIVSGAPAWVNPTFSSKEIVFVASLMTTNLGTFDRIGARKIDMSPFPATIGALTRTVTFIADIQKTSGATSVEIQLYDVDHSVQITSLLYSTNTTLVESVSGSLTVGSSSGNIRSDTPTMYEVSLRMNGGTVGIDAAYCNNARILISYA